MGWADVCDGTFLVELAVCRRYVPRADVFGFRLCGGCFARRCRSGDRRLSLPPRRAQAQDRRAASGASNYCDCVWRLCLCD
jgi:hypothetical protein